jgi:hypothetical protein
VKFKVRGRKSASFADVLRSIYPLSHGEVLASGADRSLQQNRIEQVKLFSHLPRNFSIKSPAFQGDPALTLPYQ